MSMIPAMQRFAPKVEIQPNGCWLWRAGRTGNGYGSFRLYRGRKFNPIPAHRAAYILFRGPLQPKETLDHLCRTILCMNPWHTEEVSRKVNSQRQAVSMREERGEHEEIDEDDDPFAPSDEYVEPFM